MINDEGVLPDGPTALCHPTNEGLFVGTPIRRPLRGVSTLFSVDRRRLSSRWSEVKMLLEDLDAEACVYILLVAGV